MTTLVSASLTPKEVEKLIDLADNPSNTVTSSKLDYKDSNFDIKGTFDVDMTKAKPHYYAGKLVYGPASARIKIDHLKVKIDWHNALGIKKKVCLTIKDPCGNVIFEQCVHFNLGVTTLELYSGTITLAKLEAEILDLGFADKGGLGFDLRGDVPFVAMLFEVFVTSIYRSAVESLGSLITDLLRAVFGSNWVADRLIEIVISAFKIIDKANEFIGRVIRLGLQPLDELLHNLFGDKIELTLKKDAFPKQLTILSATSIRPAVTIGITRPPRVDLKQKGLELEVFQ